MEMTSMPDRGEEIGVVLLGLILSNFELKMI